MPELCEYEGCKKRANSNDRHHCNFHATPQFKTVLAAEFKRNLFHLIKIGEPDFIGFKIPGGFSFANETFPNGANFDEAEFFGDGMSSANFQSANFQGPVSFSGAKFHKSANFSNAKFSGNSTSSADFSDVNFHKNVRFDITKFGKGEVSFYKTQFHERTQFQSSEFKSGVNFTDATFHKGETLFTNVSFGGNRTFFVNTKFPNDNLVFMYSVFKSDHTGFNLCEFGQSLIFKHKCELKSTKFTITNLKNVTKLEFDDSEFLSNSVSISNLENVKELKISNCYFSGNIELSDIVFASNSKFTFEKAKLQDSKESTVILFKDIIFPPSKSRFSEVKYPSEFEDWTVEESPIILFRYCLLKDVYFADCHMFLFSFFNSTGYEEAHLFSLNLGHHKARIFKNMALLTHHRTNRIFEETILEEMVFDKFGEIDSANDKNKDYKKKFDVDNLSGYRNVALIYRNLKLAFDHSKDYPGGSRHHFAELEMDRLSYFKEMKKEYVKSSLRKLTELTHGLIYGAYKLFTGYGNKPLWSLIWFVLLWLLFTSIHLLNGLEYSSVLDSSPSKSINYELIQIPTFFESIGQFTAELAKVITFTISHIQSAAYFFSFNTEWYTELWRIGLSFLKMTTLSTLLAQYVADFLKVSAYTISQILPAAYFPGLKTGWLPQSSELWRVGLSFLNTSVLGTLLIFIAIGLKRHFRRF